MSQDSSYFLSRVHEERSRAIAATDPRLRRAHLELAVQYAIQATVGDQRAAEEEIAIRKRSA